MIHFPTSCRTLYEALDHMPENAMLCRDALERLTDFVEGDLEADERRQVERHLADCVACSQVLEELRRTISLLHRLPNPQRLNDDAKPA